MLKELQEVMLTGSIPIMFLKISLTLMFLAVVISFAILNVTVLFGIAITILSMIS